MHHKVFFMTVFLVVIAGFGVMLLYKLNYLPQPIYTFLYQRLELASKSTFPYLQKFEGHWAVSFEPNVTGTDVVRCASETGTIEIHNGTVKGLVGELSRMVSVQAQVDPSGNLVGQTKRGSDQVGQVTATLAQGKGAGDWSDALDCKGTITLKKIEQIIDPVQAKLISFSGSVRLMRAQEESDPLPGLQLYEGDVIEVPEGGKAYLSLGPVGQPLTVLGPTNYTVVAK